MTGRPTIRTETQVEQILERVTAGEPLAQVLRDEGMPKPSTFYDWLNADPDLSGQFARAREFGADAIAAGTLDILDAPPRMVETKYGEQVDSGDVALRKARVDGRMKLLSKWDRRYADKLELDNKGELTLNVAVRRFVPEEEPAT